MEDFKDGKYALYSGKDILGEFTIQESAISYENEADEDSIGDIFPKGEINTHTAGQLNKYLHGHHAYLHLQLENSSN